MIGHLHIRGVNGSEGVGQNVVKTKTRTQAFLLQSVMNSPIGITQKEGPLKLVKNHAFSVVHSLCAALANPYDACSN